MQAHSDATIAEFSGTYFQINMYMIAALGPNPMGNIHWWNEYAISEKLSPSALYTQAAVLSTSTRE